jgi:ArsR family transcriptional regulator
MIPTHLHRLLGDDARLRLLRVLVADRFNVGELTGILGLAQSGVSRHLGLLRDAGLVAEEREAGYTFYRLARETASAHDPVWRLLEAHFDQMADDRSVRADEARLHEVLRQRKEQFDQHRIEGDETGQLVPGRSWAAWARALAHLLPPLVVADLGCGEGYLTIEAARFARRVIAVDRSATVLSRARDLAERRHVTNIAWKRGMLERVPIPDASVDLVLLSRAPPPAAAPPPAPPPPGGGGGGAPPRGPPPHYHDLLLDLGFADSAYHVLLTHCGIDGTTDLHSPHGEGRAEVTV